MKLSSLNVINIVKSIQFIFLIPPAMVMRLWKRDIWLISERYDQARDNGFIFFKYMKQKHPEKEVYYIINRKSVDYGKVKQYESIIEYNSLKHNLYYCISKVHISAHINGCCPADAPICRRIKETFGIHDVFLPHGVSYGISKFCLQQYARQDLFICSGRAEYENVRDNYGYTDKEVVYTGFPRLDEWHAISVNMKQIVLMPTWRLYYAQNPETVFEHTEYFIKYQELIKNENLCRFLKETGTILVFYLHHEMRKYVSSFRTSLPFIEIVDSDEKYDIQELLKSSALLITDYSSVHFDFAYMEKPVVYYQFDQTEFYERQYQKSAFCAEKDGFGPVVYHAEDLVNTIKELYHRNYIMQPVYKERMKAFYQLHDKKNCERVYDAINKRIQEKWER